MRRTIALSKFFIIVSALIVCTAKARNVDPSVDAQDAQTWLKKIQSAAQRQNFAGTFVYQQGTQIRTSRIAHRRDGRNEVEKLEILDGKPREYIRNNDEIVCYVPESKTLLVERRAARDVFPAILAADPADLTTNYSVQKGETARIAGRDVQAIVLEPKDNLRYGYQLWADKSTGLLLRAQTLNDKKEVIEQITFTQISIGDVGKSRVKPSFGSTAGWHVENAVMSQGGMSGWTVKSIPPGFRKIREVRRVVTDAVEPIVAGNIHASSPPHQREVLQMVFSDGLAAISVFIEPGTQSRTEGSVQQGAMNITGKRQGDFWLTIVGEVPYAAIKQVANSVEYKSR
jgi:sigma-E factor negative regulatory protein RseB